MAKTTALICEGCDRICESIEIDEGGYEEVWGAKMWHSQKVDVSDCCAEPYEEKQVDEEDEKYFPVIR